MIEINQEALTALAGFAGMFYLWMEGLFKPGVKRIVYWLRDKYKADNPKFTDEIINEYAFTIFRLVSVFGGILFVAVNDIGTSYFEVFGLVAGDNMEWVVIVTTGIAVGLGNKGVHWFVDVGRDALTMAMKWFQVKIPLETE